MIPLLTVLIPYFLSIFKAVIVLGFLTAAFNSFLFSVLAPTIVAKASTFFEIASPAITPASLRACGITSLASPLIPLAASPTAVPTPAPTQCPRTPPPSISIVVEPILAPVLPAVLVIELIYCPACANLFSTAPFNPARAQSVPITNLPALLVASLAPSLVVGSLYTACLYRFERLLPGYTYDIMFCTISVPIVLALSTMNCYSRPFVVPSLALDKRGSLLFVTPIK